MITAVIFDWIGTLYDRNKGLFPDAEQTLFQLKEDKIKMSLISLTKEQNKRALEIFDSGLKSYFSSIVISPEKSHQQYLACMHLMNSHNISTLIVDDRTIRGIRIGTELQCPTAWIKRGEYAHELPNAETGLPTYTIKTVKDIIPLLKDNQ